MPRTTNWLYLGDGVYVGFDGYGVWLHANDQDDPTDKIYLEPEVCKALIRYLILLKEGGDQDDQRP